jgi:hypothetical protein
MEQAERNPETLVSKFTLPVPRIVKHVLYSGFILWSG